MAKVNLVTRIETDLKDRLGEVAKVQNRTTSNMVEWLIKQYLEQVAKRSTTPKPESEDDAWDRQIAADAEAGKLDFLIAEAMEAEAKGRFMID